MDQNLADNGSLVARIQELELERDQLHKDIEQLCMQQAGPAYLGVAARMHFQRTAGLAMEIENLKTELAACTRENQNLQEELTEAYLMKSQLSDLHREEVLKNVEAEKQLKFFQGCVAAAFAERDNAIMEAEKAKEREELLPQGLNKSKKMIEELTSELLEEKGLATTLRIDLEKHEMQNEIFKEVIDKFYHIRRCSLENFTDASWEEKCECLLNDSDEMWSFQNDRENSTSKHISSLEAEIGTLREGSENLQNKLRVGLDIEAHLKKKVCDLEKTIFLWEEKIKKQISGLHLYHSQYIIDIKNILDEGYRELKSINDMVVEKIRQLELSREGNLGSSLVQDDESHESERRVADISADFGPASITKNHDPGLSTASISEAGDASEFLAQALQEKVAALLLLSQQEERHLLERYVNAALEKKIEELQRNLLQVTNEKVKALMELAQLKQELYKMQEKIHQDKTQEKLSGEIGGQRTIQEKDGKLKNLLKRTYLTRWVGGGFDGNDADAHINSEKPNHQMDFARMKIENATLKESLENMEHLLSSVRRLRISLSKVKDSASAKGENTSRFEALDQVLAETDLLRTALSSSLPVSWSAETSRSYSEIDSGGSDPGSENVDVVSAAGLEMVELLTFAAQVLMDQISQFKPKNEMMVTERLPAE